MWLGVAIVAGLLWVYHYKVDLGASAVGLIAHDGFWGGSGRCTTALPVGLGIT